MPALFDRKPKNGAATITAAARAVNIRDAATATMLKGVTSTAQQHEAWRLYRIASELHYPASYIGRNVGRFKFPVGWVPPDNVTTTPAVPEEADRDDLYRAAEYILMSFVGRFGDVSSLAEAYAKNMAVAGEAWLVAEYESGEAWWHVFSVREFGPADSATEGQIAYRRYPTGRNDTGIRGVPDESFTPSVVRRLWQPSPELTEYADTSTFSVIEDLKDLVTLNRSLRARIVSKLTQAGLLFLPSSLSLAGPVGVPTGDGSAVEDPFAAKLLDIVERQVLSDDAPAIPTVIRGDADAGEAIRFILTDRTIDRVELELRAEKRSAIARGMFLPPEVSEGMGSANHFAAWSVQDSGYAHLLPYACGWAESLTSIYLRPLLRDWNNQNGNRYTEQDIRRLSVIADGSDVVTRPNEAEDGRQLHDRTVISDSSLRARSGASDAEAPSDEEALRQLGRKMNNPYLATYGLPINDAVDWGTVAAVGASPGRPGVGSIDQAHRPSDSSDPHGAPGEGETQAEDDMTARVLAAATPGFLLAARKKIGAKLRARCEPNKELHASIKCIANESVLSELDLDDIDVTVADVKAWFVTELAAIADVAPDVDPSVLDAFIDHVAEREADGGYPLADLHPLASRVTLASRP